jgi:hypothetical protein
MSSAMLVNQSSVYINSFKEYFNILNNRDTIDYEFNSASENDNYKEQHNYNFRTINKLINMDTFNIYILESTNDKENYKLLSALVNSDLEIRTIRKNDVSSSIQISELNTAAQKTLFGKKTLENYLSSFIGKVHNIKTSVPEINISGGKIFVIASYQLKEDIYPIYISHYFGKNDFQPIFQFSISSVELPQRRESE